MGFADAIRICFSKYTDWKGRASRAEYWWWVLFEVIILVILDILYAATGSAIVAVLVVIGYLTLLLPGIAVLIRRLHDTGRSGAWFWIAFVPLVGGIILLVFALQPSQPGANQYGTVDGGPAAQQVR